jgi:hypothetical protein
MLCRLNIIDTKDATYWYKQYEVPKDAWVHGRYGQKTLRENVVIEGTQDWNVAEQYADNNGSMWLFKKKSGTKIIDSNSKSFIQKVWDKLNKDYESGVLSSELDDYMRRLGEESNSKSSFAEELSPDDIVDSAGVWDMMDFTEWFTDVFKYDGVLTNNGGIIILNYKKFDYSMVKEG